MRKTNKKIAGLLLIVMCLFIAINAFAITVTISRSYRVGPDSIREGVINFDSSYPTGGESFPAVSANLQSIRWMDIRPIKSGNTLKVFRYEKTSSAIQVFESSTGLEVTNGSDISNLTDVWFRATGY